MLMLATQNNTTSIPLNSTKIELGSDDEPIVVLYFVIKNKRKISDFIH